jgi:hypothetical protein
MTTGPYFGTSYQRLTLTISSREIGQVIFQICHTCQIGYIGKISIDEPHQDRGIATRALAHLRARVPGYPWSTSGQARTARTFWQRTARHAACGRRLRNRQAV